MNIRVAVCDDQESQVDYICNLIEGLACKYDIAISRFASAEEFLFKHHGEMDFDIIFLDVEMKEIDGVELAKRIRKVDEYVQLVFITGYSEFIDQGYEVDALNYLLKPLDEDKFYEVFEKAIGKLARKESYVIFNTGNGITKIAEDSIIYIEAVGHESKIFCRGEMCFVRESLGESKEILSDKFFYCHRSFIVNAKYINSITKTEILLDDGNKIPLARRKYKEVNIKFIEYYKEKNF